TPTNIQTSPGRTVATAATAYYVFTALSPGAYDVEAELEGFKKWVKTGVQLEAASSITVDVTLQTGAITESVTVIAESTPIQTDVALRKTIEAKDMELLSFSGRNPIGLVGLKAGGSRGGLNSRGFSE